MATCEINEFRMSGAVTGKALKFKGSRSEERYDWSVIILLKIIHCIHNIFGLKSN